MGHVEYKDQLRHYEQLSYEEQPWRYEQPQFNDQLRAYGPIRTAAEQYPASMHAPAVASIAVGKSVGVAPEADLYMVSPDWKIVNGMVDFTELARAVDRVVAINRQLPEGRKIRVLSMSIGWTYGWLYSPGGYSAIVEAVKRAKDQGIFVVSSSLDITYGGFNFHGLGRDPLADPDKTGSYGPGSWWADWYYRTGTISDGTETLLIPMDCRATAAMCSPVDYAFYSEGGWSWCVPYIAGLYALACQVAPDVTPESFWKAALATGDTVTLSRGSRTYDFGKIVNPARLMRALARP
ncbi:MAG: S8 family serine peptidase [Bacillota bacterium]